ncbi:RTC2 [Candida margitis]|uniref:RTC2 n=1 Tax=Candida margitis TaxID=1775924 RepID=UPI002225ED9E|nr:RTC2 [Candida margitis]KAI5969803.1 RTC2 [Candida margitis]
MTPPLTPIILDKQAISGITGSISLACWIIVFAPQIYENFTRKSSEGLSLTFIILWLAGDVFNVLGAVMQGLLPTMIILAVYYTLADVVLLWQCLVYGDGNGNNKEKGNPDFTHLSPATPINEDVLESAYSSGNPTLQTRDEEASVRSDSKTTSRLQTTLLNTLMVSLVIISGIVGWYISYVKDSHRKHKHPGEGHRPEDLIFDPLAQTFGWLCAILYLGSRVPQIVLNYERKSCDGISFMFFLFACLGNLTYVISILSIDTSWNYLWVNCSWLAGSLGTLALDFTIFVQFFLYNGSEDEAFDSESEYTSSSADERLLTGGGNNSASYGTTRE